MKFVWQDISISVDIFENIFDTVQKQLILNETSKSSEPCESSMGYIQYILIQIWRGMELTH
jgi:hypothetical protein